MELTKLGSTDLAVSRLSFGGCPMGGHGWGAVSRDDLVQAVNAALDHGINFFDTADTYGLGEGERTLGKALGRRRHQAVIATKFGVRVENGATFYDNSAKWVRTALENSLRRLGTDYVDLYQIHYRDGMTPLGEVVSTLKQLRAKGWVRHFGLSNVGVADEAELEFQNGAFVSFQDEYSLANRSHEGDIRALTSKFALTPLTWGSLGQGILTGKYSASSTFGPDDRRSRSVYVNFHGDKLAQNLRIVEVLRDVANEVGKGVPAVAIRWILDNLEGSVAIVGIKNVSQLASNVQALGWHLPDEALSALNDVSSSRELIYQESM